MTRAISVWLFFVVNLIVWLPDKTLPYLLPAGIILVYIFTPLDRKRSSKLILLLGILLFIPFLYYIPNPDFLMQNYILSLLTYSTIILILFVPSSFFYDIRYEEKYRKIILGFLVFEATVGYLQGAYAYSVKRSFDLSMGDYLDGTVHLQLASGQGIETQVFFAVILFYVLYLLPWFREKNMKVVIVMGLLVITLASVIHMFFFLILSVGISLFIYFGIRKILKYRPIRYVTLLFVGVVPALAAILQPSNIGRISYHIQNVLLFENPKAKILQRFFAEVPQDYPLSLVFGLGPGQFTSRASLFLTGEYSGQSFPLFQEQITMPVRLHMIEIWESVRHLSHFSSTFFPYYSWISWLTEFGLLGLLALVAGLVFLLVKSKKMQPKIGNTFRVIGFTTGILFLFFIGFQDNYWEMPQVVLVGVVISKMMYARICMEANGQKVKIIQREKK